jgi:hypothetical protein
LLCHEMILLQMSDAFRTNHARRKPRNSPGIIFSPGQIESAYLGLLRNRAVLAVAARTTVFGN